MVARFVHYYPGLYRSGHWPTRDRVIPFKLFVLLSAAIRHLSAEHELRAAHANAYGAALANPTSDGKAKGEMKKYTRRLIRTAFPTDDA